MKFAHIHENTAYGQILVQCTFEPENDTHKLSIKFHSEKAEAIIEASYKIDDEEYAQDEFERMQDLAKVYRLIERIFPPQLLETHEQSFKNHFNFSCCNGNKRIDLF